MRAPIAKSMRLLALSVVVGVLVGLAAAALGSALEFGTEHLVGRFATLGGAEILRFRWGVLCLPALGGLASGLIVLVLAHNAPGHGTGQLVQAFHYRDGRLQLQGPLVKAAAAVGVISCGGSAGPEGPIASLGAAIGSSLGRRLGMSPREQRVLLLAGCGGGVGAIFGCPLGGALFAASILYREPEFESECLVPAFIASVVSYSTFMAFDHYGAHLLKNADALAFQSAAELPVYLLLGLVSGMMGILFSFSISTVERRASRMRAVPVWLRPTIGGLLTGLLALALPQVMDGQYRFPQHALDGSLFAALGGEPNWLFWTVLFGLVAVGKCLATAFTVGSGGSGGLLGPSVFIGGVAGAFVGAAVEVVAPGMMPEALRASLIPVGMAGVLSAAMRIPIASMVMVIEMTGSYGLVVPLMLVTTTAYLVGRRWGLIEEQVRSAADSPAHAGDAMVHVLETYLVRDVMDRKWPFVVSPATRLPELLEQLKSGTRPNFVVLQHGRLVGLISVTDILHLVKEPAVGDIVVAADIMTRKVITINSGSTLYEALRVFQVRNIVVLPVVGNGEARGAPAFLGMLSRDDVLTLVRRQMDRVREHVLHEHAVLQAIDQENQLGQLLAGMPSPELGTIERMPIPSEIQGRSLLQADFRNVYRAQVLAIQTRNGEFICPPDPQRPLERGDQLIVLAAAAPSASGDQE